MVEKGSSTAGEKRRGRGAPRAVTADHTQHAGKRKKTKKRGPRKRGVRGLGSERTPMEYHNGTEGKRENKSVARTSRGTL